MRVNYEPIVIVGVSLEDLFKYNDRGFKDMWALRDYLAMVEDFVKGANSKDVSIIGLELPNEMEIGMATINTISKVAKTFEKVTGLQPKIHACLVYW
jgi:hypothetical protein